MSRQILVKKCMKQFEDFVWKPPRIDSEYRPEVAEGKGRKKANLVFCNICTQSREAYTE